MSTSKKPNIMLKIEVQIQFLQKDIKDLCEMYVLASARQKLIREEYKAASKRINECSLEDAVALEKIGDTLYGISMMEQSVGPEAPADTPTTPNLVSLPQPSLEKGFHKHLLTLYRMWLKNPGSDRGITSTEILVAYLKEQGTYVEGEAKTNNVSGSMESCIRQEPPWVIKTELNASGSKHKYVYRITQDGIRAAQSLLANQTSGSEILSDRISAKKKTPDGSGFKVIVNPSFESLDDINWKEGKASIVGTSDNFALVYEVMRGIQLSAEKKYGFLSFWTSIDQIVDWCIKLPGAAELNDALEKKCLKMQRTKAHCAVKRLVNMGLAVPWEYNAKEMGIRGRYRIKNPSELWSEEHEWRSKDIGRTEKFQQEAEVALC